MTAQALGPTLRQRRIASELRRLRAEAGLTLDAVAEATGLSAATISRIENREVRPRPLNVKALLEAYGAGGTPLATEMLRWAKDINVKGWWHSYSEPVMSAPYKDLTALEQEAAEKRSFEPLIVPGLLQTEAYARQVSDILAPSGITDELRQDRVNVRLRRQDRLESMIFRAICTEEMFHRIVGGPAVMKEQIEYILDRCRSPRTSIRLIPANAGAHPGMQGSFSLLRFEDAPEDDVAYLESTAGQACIEDAEQVERLQQRFDHLDRMALNERESRRILERLTRNLS